MRDKNCDSGISCTITCQFACSENITTVEGAQGQVVAEIGHRNTLPVVMLSPRNHLENILEEHCLRNFCPTSCLGRLGMTTTTCLNSSTRPYHQQAITLKHLQVKWSKQLRLNTYMHRIINAALAMAALWSKTDT